MKHKKFSKLTIEQMELVENNLNIVKLACFQLRDMTQGNRSLQEELESVGYEQLCVCASNCDNIDNFPAYAMISVKFEMIRFIKKEYAHGVVHSNNVKASALKNFFDPSFVDGEDSKDSITFIEEMTDLIASFTQDEKDFFNLCVDGKSTKEIADILDMKLHSVYGIAKNVKKKMIQAFFGTMESDDLDVANN